MLAVLLVAALEPGALLAGFGVEGRAPVFTCIDTAAAVAGVLTTGPAELAGEALRFDAGVLHALVSSNVGPQKSAL